MTTTERLIASADAHGAHTYHPLPVVVATADGAWTTDAEGRRYLDLPAGYSALDFGHGNRRLIDAARAVVASREVLGVFRPGEHGSAFGGNPRACAVALEVIAMLRSGEYQGRAAELGKHLHRELGLLADTGQVTAVRGRGLWAGVDIAPECGTGREISEQLTDRGVLVKDTRGVTVRIAPPLVIGKEDLDWGLAQLRGVLGA